jgi:hypothetical protein
MQTVTRTPSVYSPSGFEISSPTPGSRPEPTQQEREAAREADKVRFSTLCREYHWTPAQFEAMQAGITFFPKKRGDVRTAGTFGVALGTKTEAVFSREQFARFFEQMRDLAALLPR